MKRGHHVIIRLPFDETRDVTVSGPALSTKKEFVAARELAAYLSCCIAGCKNKRELSKLAKLLAQSERPGKETRVRVTQ